MEATLFLKNKLLRHIKWNGQPITFVRYAKNDYGELVKDEIEQTFSFRGLFHDGGGYGGMLNYELYERDGSRNLTKMKPMILCAYEDGNNLVIDDVTELNGKHYKLIEKNDVKALGIVYELSLEVDKYSDEDLDNV